MVMDWRIIELHGLKARQEARLALLGELARRERAVFEFDGEEVAAAEVWASGDLEHLGGLMGVW
jgi:hypothetical protein